MAASKIKPRVALHQLQYLADTCAAEALESQDAQLASFARILGGIATFATTANPTAEETKSLEVHLAGWLTAHGVPLHHTRTIQMRRPQKSAGSARATFIDDLTGHLCRLSERGEASQDRLAQEIANAFFYDYPGECGPIRPCDLDEMTRIAWRAIERFGAADLEKVIISFAKALKIPNARSLFSYRDAQEKRKSRQS